MKQSLIPRPNFLVALLSTVALFIISALAAILMTLEKPIVGQINRQIYQIVELKEQSSPYKAELLSAINSDLNVDSSSIQWMTGEDAVLFMKQETGLDFVLDGENPFSDLITFKVKSSIYEPELINLEQELNGHKAVNQVFFQHEYFDQVKEFLAKWRTISIWVAGLLFVVAITILSGLFRLILYAERKKIKTMELVGASKWYIMRPYLGRFILVGIISMLSAAGIFWIVWRYYLRSIDLDWSIFLTESSWMSVGIVWTILFLCIILISVHILRSFLHKSLEELE